MYKLIKWCVLVLTGMVVAISGAAAIFLIMVFQPGPLKQTTIIDIPLGTGVLKMGDILQAGQVIDHGLYFTAAVLLGGQTTHLKAGEYQFTPQISLDQVIDKISRGQVVEHHLTIPEGRSVKEVIKILNNDDRLSGPVTLTIPEGTLLPETYQFVRGTTRDEMIKRLKNAMDQALATTWAARPQGFILKSPQELLTLASIVEKETGVAAERPHIAGVFLNRLRLGMRLQSDPTVIYAINGGDGPLGRKLWQGDLQRTDSPYNTYLYAGLPPGPITNPGIDSLRAVINPLPTRDLYFVADGTGGHAFAENLSDHNRNVQNWRRIRDAE